jgi:ferric-dicitrate binding protein FerR (iron transport regulator)
MEEKLNILLRKFFRNEADAKEINRLKKVFEDGRAEEELADFYEEAWSEAEPVYNKEMEDRVWGKLHAKIHPEATVKPYDRKKFIRVAAAILIPLICVFTGYYYAKISDKTEIRSTTVSVETGQKASVKLPDGTLVWLNSAGSLEYDNNYNKKDRIVHLYGEAFFKVKKDKRPFIVKTNDISIEALGTSFDVKAYPDDSYIAATLIEGSIKVSSPLQSELLHPNEKITIDRNDGHFTKAILHDADRNISWIRRQIAFEQERLEDIAKDLERMYSVRIEFASEQLKDIRFSGTIKNNNLENILQIIDFVSHVSYTIDGNGTIRIKEK